MKYIRILLKNQSRVLNFLIYLCLFLFAIYPYRDYDWGWHLKQGEYFFTHWAVYRSDTFSWTMAGYHWINHEWLYDPLVFILYHTVSFWGLSLAGALATIGAFYFGVKGFKVKPYQLAICAFFFGYLTSGVVWQGLRAQVVGLLFIAIGMYLLRLLDQGHKKIYILLPLFFLLWANMHGTFAMGLAIFSFYVAQKVLVDSIKDGKIFISKNLLYLLLSYVASILAVMINPFGIGVYFEALRHLNNPLLKYIGEWDPVQFPSTFYMLMLSYFIVLVVVMFLTYRKTRKINIYMTGVILFTGFLEYGARRYVAVSAVATLPFFAEYLSTLQIPIEKFRVTTFLVVLFILITLEMAIFRRVLPWRIFQNYSITDYCSFGSGCSEGLLSYVKKHPAVGRGFNFYDWGGYLIGRGVPMKLFVDGRMHLWKNEKNNYSAFWDYEQIYYENNLKLFNQYNFQWVIVPSNANISVLLKYGKLKGNWKLLYDDGKGAYWVRTK